MFNLIPETLKEKIIKDYTERRVVVWLFGVCVLMGTFFIFLLPTYTHVFFEEQNTLGDAERIKNSVQFKKADQVAQTIKETNTQLKVLEQENRSVNPINSIQQIIGTKNAAIRIYEIEYTEIKATSSIVVIKGVADRRDALRQFVTNLESIKGFSNIELPVSNFVKDKDIDFTISITAS